MTILGADIGGTKTLIGLAQYDNSGWQLCAQQRYSNQDYASADTLIREFIADHDIPDTAALAVAGPVNTSGFHTTARLTNLDWALSSQSLQTQTGVGTVELINDFVALGYSLPLMQDDDLLTLQTGHPNPAAPMALLGAGTGLGQALVINNSGQTCVYPSEGGHVDFAPQSQQQIELYQFLAEQYGHVSVERLLSGPGLENIYRFLSAGSSLPAAEISQAGVAKPDSLQGQALSLFASIYGAQAGNVALNYMPGAGLFLAGGVTAKLAHYLGKSKFVDSFLDKGRFGDYLGHIPIHIIRSESAGLTGALQRAWLLAQAVKKHE